MEQLSVRDYAPLVACTHGGVLERLQVDQVMKELNFASASLTEDDVEHIGRALNADALVFGTAVSAGGGMVIVNARMVEVAGRTIIEAGRVTAHIPPSISLAALPEPAAVTTRAPGTGALLDQTGDGRDPRDVFGTAGGMAPVRVSLEIDGIAATVSAFRTLEIVGGTDQLSFHDGIATFTDVAIQKSP